MELTQFRVRNFRSVNDSGDIAVSKLTALVGRNESGKSNLLLALASLKPPKGFRPLSPIKDFPRGRRLQECTDDTHVVDTRWKLTKEESAELGEMLGPENEQITEVTVSRLYGKMRQVGLIGLKEARINEKSTRSTARRLGPVLSSFIEQIADANIKSHASAAWKRLNDSMQSINDELTWCGSVIEAGSALRKAFGQAKIVVDTTLDELLAELESQAERVGNFNEAYGAARTKIVEWLPTFIYVSEFPEIYGHQNLDEFVGKRGQDPKKKEAEDNFEKMALVADFDPAVLNAMRSDHETRNQLLNRAGALVTQEIRRLWKDRALKVRFNIDGPHLDTLISDPNAVYDVEVNLDERSRGFRWFFAFYITFAADTDGGHAEGAILLLDEPGLHLHAKSQEDLTRHLRTDFTNQILYTTHSPFMIPPDAIDIVRTVSISQERGTSVANSPAGDSRTLFPLQAALGYQLAQTLFVGHSNLVVEGVTDFWILSAVNAHFLTTGTHGLPDQLTVTPAGGAGKVSYMAALLASEELKVLVLLDDDRAGRDTQTDLVKAKLLRDTAIMFVTEGFSDRAIAKFW